MLQALDARINLLAYVKTWVLATVDALFDLQRGDERLFQVARNGYERLVTTSVALIARS